MNTDAVLAFAAVADEGQFQLAACRLGISQQATSKVGERHPLAGAAAARLPELARYPAWVPGIVAGSEWEAFYADLAGAFGLDIDPTGYAGGTGSVFDAVAASSSLVTFVGEKSRVALPAGAGLVRLPVTDPVPAYPWSLIWASRSAHPGTRLLVEHTARAFRSRRRAVGWLPRQASDDAPRVNVP